MLPHRRQQARYLNPIALIVHASGHDCQAPEFRGSRLAALLRGSRPPLEFQTCRGGAQRDPGSRQPSDQVSRGVPRQQALLSPAEADQAHGGGREVCRRRRAQSEGAEQAAEAVTASTRPTIDVRLRVGPSFALRWLVPRLGRLHERQPNIKLHVIGAYGYFDPVHRDFDVALEFLQASVPALHSEVLMEEYLTPVCSPEYLTQHAFLRTVADLARSTLLHDGDAWEAASEDAEWRHWLHEVGALDIDSSQGQFFTLANMAIEAALAHQGVAMGRLSLVEELLASGRLVAPFPQRIRCPIRYYLVYPEEFAPRPGVRAITEWLRRKLRSWSG